MVRSVAGETKALSHAQLCVVAFTNSNQSPVACSCARPSKIVLRVTCHVVPVNTWLCELLTGDIFTDVTRLNFFEVARAAFFSKYQILVRGTRYEVARAGLVH